MQSAHCTEHCTSAQCVTHHSSYCRLYQHSIAIAFLAIITTMDENDVHPTLQRSVQDIDP